MQTGAVFTSLGKANKKDDMIGLDCTKNVDDSAEGSRTQGWPVVYSKHVKPKVSKANSVTFQENAVHVSRTERYGLHLYASVFHKRHRPRASHTKPSRSTSPVAWAFPSHSRTHAPSATATQQTQWEASSQERTSSLSKHPEHAHSWKAQSAADHVPHAPTPSVTFISRSLWA